ncbi:MurR/RpiR family transcriptional regulator [Mesorhizobium sp. M0862]|uniref:MurR/RpiR family transcriptional regulator n=1 Tax=Mesorhizobium sp. M0862 TaxID=2957015 RepID=UPI00333DAFAF
MQNLVHKIRIGIEFEQRCSNNSNWKWRVMAPGTLRQIPFAGIWRRPWKVTTCVRRSSVLVDNEANEVCKPVLEQLYGFSTMKQTNEPLSYSYGAAEILGEIATRLASFTPELQKAAAHVLENPNLISVSSIRKVARDANVKPNTLVRMARALGFEGYEDFRNPFREKVIRGREDFPDRARWLQSLSKGGKFPKLYAEMATASIENIEVLFSKTDATVVKNAAEAIVSARTTYVLGVGIATTIAGNFAYIASMAVGNVVAIPRDGTPPVDGLIRADKNDLLIAMTFRPYRREVVEAVNVALAHGIKVIGISDSAASPILAKAKHRFVVPMDSPQFFTSTVALSALFETIMAFVIAEAGPEAVSNIERFHQRRHQIDIYRSKDQ